MDHFFVIWAVSCPATIARWLTPSPPPSSQGAAVTLNTSRPTLFRNQHIRHIILDGIKICNTHIVIVLDHKHGTFTIIICRLFDIFKYFRKLAYFYFIFYIIYIFVFVCPFIMLKTYTNKVTSSVC